MIRVALADDHPVVRLGLVSLVDSVPDLSAVAEFATAEELLAWLPVNTCDVVLLDLQFGQGRMTGAEAAAAIVASGGPPVLILTTYATDADIVNAVEAGAAGYLLKDAPTGELAEAVRAAAAGRTPLSPVVQRRLLDRVRLPAVALTLRELDTLRLVAEGLSNQAVADRLVVTQATVKSHLAHAYAKLGAQSRTEALSIARERGLIA